MASADGAPTKQAIEVHDLVVAEIDTNLAELKKLFDQNVNDFNNEVSAMKVPFIFVDDNP